MKIVTLLVLGFVLEVLAGTLGQVFHLEWFRPDPLLALVAYASLIVSTAPGAATVFLLGIVADWAGAGTGGLATMGYLTVWLVLHAGRRWLWPELALVRALLIVAAGLTTSLFGFLYLLLAGSPSTLIKFQLSVLPLLLLFDGLLGIAVWYIVDRLLGTQLCPDSN